MKLDPLGDSAYVLRDLGDVDPSILADWLNENPMPGFIEANCCYETVGVYCSDEGIDIPTLISRLGEFVSPLNHPPVVHRIPVCYEMGEDIAEVCQRVNLDLDRIATVHCSVDYRCYAVGFSPGFPYLGYLPDSISMVPRRPSPRSRVPAGSVAIAYRQTAVYPQSTPGGWNIIGRTPLMIADMKSDYFPIEAGHFIRFERIAPAEFERSVGKRL